jgi:uncharacterized repeat protein (TIGR03803 family)
MARLRSSCFALRISLVLLALGLLGAGTLRAQITTLTSFDGTNIANPNTANLVVSGGIIYGTASNNVDPNANGTIYSLPVSGGTPTVLSSFNYSVNGGEPGGLMLNGDTLYGTTFAGPNGTNGTVYSVPLTGGAPNILTTFNYNNGSGGYGPSGGSLVLSGNTLYGTTYAGGTSNNGTVFSLPLSGGTPTILTNFNGSNGWYPSGNLILSADGTTLFGTTSEGGAYNDGVVFSLPVIGGTPTILASLGAYGGATGMTPPAGLTLSAEGRTLYGVANVGGYYGDGVVFSVPVTGSSNGNPTLLAVFNGTNGNQPNSNLLLVGDTLYGTTSGGGANGYGDIFSVPVDGSGVITDLADFNGANGSYPTGGGLTLDGTTLYGTTWRGGANDYGTVFSLALPVPEPESVGLLAMAGVFGLATARRRG